MYGRRRAAPKPAPALMSEEELEQFRAESDADFAAGAGRVKSTVEATCEIVVDLKRCVSEVAAPPKSNHAPNGAH